MTTRVSLTMIVRNESATLANCLTSVRDLVDEIIVVDTGSSDNTKDIAKQHGACVFDLPWPDSFAVARNEAIRHATGQWLLWLDADEHLDDSNRDKLRVLLANLQDDNSAYAMLSRSATANGSVILVDHVRLFRNHPAIRWEYRIHEQIIPNLRKAGYAIRSTDIAIEHFGYLDPTLHRNKFERNLRLLHLDLADRPNDPCTLFYLGWTLTAFGRWSEAIPLLQCGLQHSPPAYSATPRLYALLTRCHHSLGQHTEAWNVCQAGHVRYPDDAELRFLKDLLLGQLYLDRGDRAAARRYWTQLLEDCSQTVAVLAADGVFRSVDTGRRGPLVRHRLALLDLDEGKFADAEKHWRALLHDRDPLDSKPARLGLAELYLRQIRWAELVKLLSELEPDAPLDAALLRARMYLARQKFNAARQLLEQVIRQDPHALMPHVILSQVLLQSGEKSAAEPLLRRIVEMDPGHAESWRNLAMLYRRTDRLSEAIAAERAAGLPCPRDADWMFTTIAAADVGERDGPTP